MKQVRRETELALINAALEFWPVLKGLNLWGDQWHEHLRDYDDEFAHEVPELSAVLRDAIESFNIETHQP